MIGKSLSFCVKDIVEGKVALADVERIVAGTFYTDRDMFHTGLRADYCRTYWRLNPTEAHRVAMRLWDDGKIDQPRCRGEDAPNIADGHWY